MSQGTHKWGVEGSTVGREEDVIAYICYMGRNEIIEHWATMAERDWASAELLLKGRQYVHALFFAHLVIEKWLKALG